MAQHNDIIRDQSRRYDRADYSALRALLQGVEVCRIRNVYYDEVASEQKGINSDADLKRHLERMRADVAEDLICANPLLENSVREMLRTGKWSKLAADYLLAEAEKRKGVPRSHDAVGVWFKPVLAKRLREDGIESMQHLVSRIAHVGLNWWRGIPCIGAGKAACVIAFLRTHASALEFREPPSRTVSTVDVVVELSPEVESGSMRPIPLEMIRLASGYQRGSNRGSGFCLVAARNDLEAAVDYLDRYRDRPHTYRAYRKEIERFILWCILVRRKAMSDADATDCTKYVRFLADPDSKWIGPRAPRHSEAWRPFAGPLKPDSAHFATQVLGGWMQWLVNVRYLSANPWVAAARPTVQSRLHPIQIERALPESLWSKLVVPDSGILDTLARSPDYLLIQRYRIRGAGVAMPFAKQFRLLRAVILVIGLTGLRREEAAGALRSDLQKIPNRELWRLNVLGKRQKWRTVFLPASAIDALHEHWRDRDEDFLYETSPSRLFSPIIVPPTNDAAVRHETVGKGFTPGGLARMITRGLARIAHDDALNLDDSERTSLLEAGTHGFRHTFATITLTTAGGVSLDIVQKILGHASLDTTSIYIQQEHRRFVDEFERYFMQTINPKKTRPP